VGRHEAVLEGDGANALRELALVMRDALGPKADDGYATATGTIVTPE
jgi:hypothetical protein